MTITADPPAEQTSAPAATGKHDGPAVEVKPTRTHRGRGWMAASIALVLAGGTAGVFVYGSMSHSTQVFVASTAITRGTPITKADLTTISITSGQNTAALPATQADSIIGKIATDNIPAGGLITRNALTGQLPVPAGKALVGLTLKTAQLPAQHLAAGDRIYIVPVPTQGTTTSSQTTTQPQTTPATVSQVVPVPNSTAVTVDVYVDAQNAPAVTAQAAAGDLAIFLTADKAH